MLTLERSPLVADTVTPRRRWWLAVLLLLAAVVPPVGSRAVSPGCDAPDGVTATRIMPCMSMPDVT